MRTALCIQLLARAPQVPREEGFLSVLHITPVRATRSLALRFLVHKFGKDMGQVVLVSLVPQVQASPPDASSADSLLVGNYTADTEDLLGGMQKASARGQHPEGATSARGATTHSAPPPRACRWCSCRTPPSRLPGEPRCPTAPLSAAWACRQHPTWLQGACMCVSQARWLACWASCWSARPRRATKTAPVQPPHTYPPPPYVQLRVPSVALSAPVCFVVVVLCCCAVCASVLDLGATDRRFACVCVVLTSAPVWFRSITPTARICCCCEAPPGEQEPRDAAAPE